MENSQSIATTNKGRVVDGGNREVRVNASVVDDTAGINSAIGESESRIFRINRVVRAAEEIAAVENEVVHGIYFEESVAVREVDVVEREGPHSLIGRRCKSK